MACNAFVSRLCVSVGNHTEPPNLRRTQFTLHKRTSQALGSLSAGRSCQPSFFSSNAMYAAYVYTNTHTLPSVGAEVHVQFSSVRHLPAAPIVPLSPGGPCTPRAPTGPSGPELQIEK
jgi:hypothetical protein